MVQPDPQTRSLQPGWNRFATIIRSLYHGLRRSLHWIWHLPVHPRQRCVWRSLLVLILIGLTIRSLPYLSPIRATDLVQDDQAITGRDRNGLLLGTLLSRDQNHTAVVPLIQVSPYFIQAILAAEDKRFYQHGALDLWAVGRAIAEAMQARQIVSGASTITMQLARMINPAPRTFREKLEEVWVSWRLVAGMTKDEILHAYINRLPMGSNIYGVEAAARTYFGIPARDLTLAQASLLAALPNDPNQLSPYDHWDALKKRQQYVLHRMVGDRYITSVQADRARTETVGLQPRQQGILAAPHYLFWVANHLPPDHPPQVRTTLDLPLQRFVETQVQQVIRSLTRHQVNQAAVLVLENTTGNVLAYVGSVDYFAETAMGRNDGVQALRQPGSTLKPFLYKLALEKRVIRPNTVLADVPTYYAIPGARLYRPQDYSDTFQGPVRVRVALANSLNVPAVRVLEKVGVAPFLDRLRDLGFHHLTHPPEYYGLGLTLGSGEVSLWELAHAYRWIAQQANTDPTWALITDMLGDRHARAHSFGVDSVLSLPFAAAVKTGTSSDFRDTWTVGFTRDYTVAVWVGNFDGAPMQQVSGVTGAAPLWSRILLHLHDQQEPLPFAPPAGLVSRPICALSGMKPTPACPTVVQEYFYPQDLIAYEQQPDPFYRAIASTNGRPQYQLTLPPEYNEWLATQAQPALSSGDLRIVFPQNNDYFVMATPRPGTPPGQRLEFRLASRSDQPVEWWLNGKRLASGNSDSLFWSLQPGDWTLQVRDTSGTDQVNFQVRMAEPRSKQRGFSVNSGRITN